MSNVCQCNGVDDYYYAMQRTMQIFFRRSKTMEDATVDKKTIRS